MNFYVNFAAAPALLQAFGQGKDSGTRYKCLLAQEAKLRVHGSHAKGWETGAELGVRRNNNDARKLDSLTAGIASAVMMVAASFLAAAVLSQAPLEAQSNEAELAAR